MSSGNWGTTSITTEKKGWTSHQNSSACFRGPAKPYSFRIARSGKNNTLASDPLITTLPPSPRPGASFWIPGEPALEEVVGWCDQWVSLLIIWCYVFGWWRWQLWKKDLILMAMVMVGVDKDESWGRVKILMGFIQKVGLILMIDMYARRLSVNHYCPQSVMTTLDLGLPWPEPTPCILSTIAFPSTTLPKTQCLPSSQGQSTKVMKNWDPLVLGPALAMDRR